MTKPKALDGFYIWEQNNLVEKEALLLDKLMILNELLVLVT